MRTESDPSNPKRRSRRIGPIVGATILVATLALVLPLVPSASAASYGGPGPASWTNGLVLCEFSSSTPSVGVSAYDVAGPGLNASALSMTEVAPGGTTVASADLAGAVWDVTNASDDDAYELAYSAHVSLDSGASAAGPRWAAGTIGTADVSVDFVLPAYSGSPDGPTDTVSVVLGVSNWTWQNSADHLVLSLGAAVSDPSVARLNATNAPGWLLASTSAQTGQVAEQLGVNTTATAVAPTGGSVPILATSSVQGATASNATVTVVFGTAAGAFSSLSFTAWVGVVLPATVAGIPIADLAATAVAGALVSALVAVSVRRVRQKPSRLIYVTEEEER